MRPVCRPCCTSPSSRPPSMSRPICRRQDMSGIAAVVNSPSRPARRARRSPSTRGFATDERHCVGARASDDDGKAATQRFLLPSLPRWRLSRCCASPSRRLGR
jgi:hypothetical protein